MLIAVYDARDPVDQAAFFTLLAWISSTFSVDGTMSDICSNNSGNLFSQKPVLPRFLCAGGELNGGSGSDGEA